MTVLPTLNRLDQFAELTVDTDEPFDRAHCPRALFPILQREDRTECWFRRAFQHVLAFFVEARCDRVVLFENNQ
jgi:hypothetical protein